MSTLCKSEALKLIARWQAAYVAFNHVGKAPKVVFRNNLFHCDFRYDHKPKTPADLLRMAENLERQITPAASLINGVAESHIRILTQERDALLSENELLKRELAAWPGRAADHARTCVARERARLEEAK